MLFGLDKIPLKVDDAPCDLSQIYDDLRALERENWVTLPSNDTWQANRGLSTSWRANAADPDRETPTSPEVLSEVDTAAPPIPPRMSSWNRSTPTHLDTELHIPDSPLTTIRKCHSPCVLVDRKCNSPSIVRKFGAMLQENEGKVLIDGVVASCSAPANPKCNIGCCHNRWSCDASKFVNSKSSTNSSVQKSFSEVNILSPERDLSLDYSPSVRDLKVLEMHLIVQELPVDLLLSSLEISPASLKPQGSKRNIMLEQKTAEFNRTLFQAEMGRSVEEPDSFRGTDACASTEVLPPKEATFDPHCNDVTTSIMGVHPEDTLSLSTLDSTIHEVQTGRMKRGPEGQEVRMNLLTEQTQVGPREAPTKTSQSPSHHPELKHKDRTASSPSRKTQHGAATEALFSETVLPENTHSSQNGKNNENPSGAKLQPARVGVSLQQPPAESKQRQMTQSGHQAQQRHASVLPSQSDSSRQGPRMMNDHPWKPLTLAAYPRPEGSRSNYGAVERILKNYESAARAQQSQSQQVKVSPSPNVSVRQEETVSELDMLDMDPLPLPPTLRHTQTSHTSQIHTTHTQPSSHNAMSAKETELTVQVGRA